MCTRLFTLAVLPAGARREEINRRRWSRGSARAATAFSCGERRRRGREIRWLFDGRRQLRSSFRRPASANFHHGERWRSCRGMVNDFVDGIESDGECSTATRCRAVQVCRSTAACAVSSGIWSAEYYYKPHSAMLLCTYISGAATAVGSIHHDAAQ